MTNSKSGVVLTSDLRYNFHIYIVFYGIQIASVMLVLKKILKKGREIPISYE